MDNRIVIHLPNGFDLVAEQNTDPNYPNEIFIGITDGNGAWWQDLAIVRNAYTYNSNLDVIWKNEEFEALVYSDKDNEDFTHKYSIELYHGGV